MNDIFVFLPLNFLITVLIFKHCTLLHFPFLPTEDTDVSIFTHRGYRVSATSHWLTIESQLITIIFSVLSWVVTWAESNEFYTIPKKYGVQTTSSGYYHELHDYYNSVSYIVWNLFKIFFVCLHVSVCMCMYACMFYY